MVLMLVLLLKLVLLLMMLLLLVVVLAVMLVVVLVVVLLSVLLSLEGARTERGGHLFMAPTTAAAGEGAALEMPSASSLLIESMESSPSPSPSPSSLSKVISPPLFLLQL
jgi:hypothetical protein